MCVSELTVVAKGDLSHGSRGSSTQWCGLGRFHILPNRLIMLGVNSCFDLVQCKKR